jgi:hypothetical protein
MDGFDEISPTHADKAAVILSELLKTKVGRLWVTSRPVMKGTLENLLCVPAFTLKNLSRQCQEKMLYDIWKENTNEIADNGLHQFTRHLLMQVNESVYQRNLTGCPLYITMIASAFEENMNTFLEFGIFILAPKVNLLDLYDTFVETKLHIYETEKKWEDMTKASVVDDHERLMETYLENLEKCSLLVTLPTELDLLHDQTIERRIQPFVMTVQAGKDKIGILMNVVEGKPQFVHRTFAEYFAARWFSKNFESNGGVLEHILFDRKYTFVRDMFNRILARGCPLHCAVLEGDTQAVEAILQDGSDVNARDKGGRTAMHLIAAEPHDAHLCKEITESLLRHGAFVDATDNVLQWTPLQYAVKAENWVVADQLW